MMVTGFEMLPNLKGGSLESKSFFLLPQLKTETFGL